MRGLALSGGAAFGAYQIGVWRALSERSWQPDVTTGISIGAVNAWLFARDIALEELDAIWLDWPAEMLPGRERRFDLPWRVHVPLFRAWIQRIAAEYGGRPVLREGRMTMLEAATGRMRTISVANAGATELLAACALPGVMAPIRTDAGLCLDCGILRYIPIPETIEAGADEIILVDLLAAHPIPLLRRVRRMLDRLIPTPPSDRLTAQVTVVGHEAPLGGVLECFRWRRSFVERLANQGYSDARSVVEGRLLATNPAPKHTMTPSPVNAAPQ